MRLPGRKSDADLSAELREQHAAARRAAAEARDTGRPMPDRETALGELQRSAGEARDTRRELRKRGESTANIGEQTRRDELLGGREPKTNYERLILEQAIAERDRKVASERQRLEAERRRADERSDAGVAIEPLWNDEPHLEACAILASGRAWSWSRAIAIRGEEMTTWDGTVITAADLEKRDLRLPSAMIDAAEIAVLFAVSHLISERGTNGVVVFNSRQSRLWPVGLDNVAGSLRRLAEVGYLRIDLTNVSAWRIQWGWLAQEELAKFVASFTPPTPAKQTRRERKQEQSAPSSLPPSGAADRERAAESREEQAES